MYNYNWIFE